MPYNPTYNPGKSFFRNLTVTLLAIVCVSQTAVAQVKFDIPDTLPSPASYTDHYQCIAAFDRIAYDSFTNFPIPDTTEFVFGALEIVHPKTAVNFLKECLEGKSYSQVDTSYGDDLWLRALAYLGRFQELRSFVFRNIDTLDPGLPADTRLKALHRFITTSFYARPTPRDPIVEARNEMKLLMKSLTATLSDSLLRHWERVLDNISFSVASMDGDTAAMREYTQKMLSDSAYLALVRKDESGPYTILDWMTHVHFPELMDSMRAGKEAYNAIKRAHWNFAKGDTVSPLPQYFGITMPPIDGTWWYSRADGEQGDILQKGRDVELKHSQFPAPVAGKVNMLLYLTGCRDDNPSLRIQRPRNTGMNRACQDMFYTVRRLKAKYPEIQITILMHTLGFFGASDTIPPKQEADLYAEWLLKHQKLPANLIVAENSYFRVPGFDQRRIDNIPEYRINYLGRQAQNTSTFVVLITPDTWYIDRLQINRYNQQNIEHYLKVLLR